MWFEEILIAIVPIGALYTPLKVIEEKPLLDYEPVVCKAPCRAVLNPYWHVSSAWHMASV